MGANFEISLNFDISCARSHQFLGNSGLMLARMERKWVEGPNGTFCLVVAIHIRWDLFLLAFPFVGNAVDVCGAGFVVEYLRVDCYIPCLKPFHDDAVGRDSMMIRFGLEGLDKDGVGSVVLC